MLEIVKLGLSNLRRHALRSLLTALGIILGVGAVITNEAINEGSTRKAIAELEALGAQNIIIRSSKPPESAQGNGQRRSFTTRYGLTRQDLSILQQEFASAKAIVPLKAVGGQFIQGPLRKTSQAYGTTPQFFDAARLTLARGTYLTQEHLDERAMVAVIGAETAKSLFPFDDPLGQTIGIDSKRLKVIGILAPIGLAGGAGAALVGRDLNFDLHMPITTANEVFGDSVFRATSGSMSSESIQVSEVFIVAPTSDSVMQYAALADRVIETRHPGKTDITIIVPAELLERVRKERISRTMVAMTIAGISLLVGGIGIMNIMLASVTERTREIGIRRALGATRRHIVWQFLVETGVLSTAGGLVGIVVGLGFSRFLSWLVPRINEYLQVSAIGSDGQMPIHVTLGSIMVSFCVAAATGLVFGLYPAIRASRQDPIEALRHD